MWYNRLSNDCFIVFIKILHYGLQNCVNVTEGIHAEEIYLFLHQISFA